MDTSGNRRIIEDIQSRKVVVDNGVRVVSSGMHMNPLGVFTIIPGVQWELGRDVRDFIKDIRKAKAPLAVQRVRETHSRETWEIIRVPMDGLPDIKICTFRTEDSIVKAVSYNQAVIYDERFKGKIRLSAAHQLRANNISAAVIGMTALTGIRPDEVRMEVSKRSIVVYKDLPEIKLQYRYLFSKDSRDVFNLLGISMKSK